MKSVTPENLSRPPVDIANTPDRIAGLDILRIVSALGIICIHVPETKQLQTWTSWCRFSVPAFTAMSVFLLVLGLRRRQHQPAIPFIRRRFTRLYALFLFWNVVYLVARLLKKAFVASGDSLRLAPGTIFLSGFAEHLWYLSFIAWLGILMAGCTMIYLRLNRSAALLFALLTFGSGIIICLAMHHFSMDLDGWPSSYFIFLGAGALPAGCAGLLIAWLWLHVFVDRGRLWLGLLFAAGAFLIMLTERTGALADLYENLAGVLLVLSALALPLKNLPGVVVLAAAMTLPVYCVHVLIIETLQAFTHKLHLDKSALLDTGTFLVTVAGSCLFAWLLQQPGRKSWLVTLHR